MKATFYIVFLFSVLMFMGSCQEEVIIADDDILHTWEATTFVSVESVAYPMNEDSAVLLTFKRDGSYSLKLDVNNCMGSYETGEGDSISISTPGCTKMCCDSPFSVKLAGTLSKVTTYSIDDNTLQLHVPAWGLLEFELVE
ncbi:MAG TPA: META domain-containing protein [Prolixibacteraceae bacterium]|nr:META domain-containing protein [Prolixibacteraceae bacterium]